MAKKGKLIVIDGTDGSGKATQVALLVKRLKKDGKIVKVVDFPEYYKNFFGAQSIFIKLEISFSNFRALLRELIRKFTSASCTSFFFFK